MAAGEHQLPVLKGPVDPMRTGAVAFKHSVLTAHPVETIQKTHFKNEWEASLFITEKVYGSAAAFEKRLDRAVLATFQRGAPTLPSSHALVDTFLGRDDKLAVEDLMNLPEDRPKMPRVGVHDQIEAKLGISTS